MPQEPQLATGVYERLIDRELATLLEELRATVAQRRSVEKVEAPQRLADFTHRVLARRLAGLDLADQVALTNRLLEVLGEGAPDAVVEPLSLLTAIHPPLLPGQDPPEHPVIPLSDSDLLVNGRGEPRLGEALKRELLTADRVDFLVAFIRWTGLRIVLDELEELSRRDVPLRVLTTTYLGSTERKALDALVGLGADVKVSYDTRSTRLHAKAWLIHRRTGYSTAFIGSSNLSRAALLDGMEWNVRVAQAHAPSLLEKIAGTFESYWNDPEFERYDPAVDSERFDRAVAEERGGYTPSLTIASGLEVRPWHYQQHILDALEVERLRHDRWRNLVIAPTGTGKTVVAALDYRRLGELTVDLGRRPRLLFVAHRSEILEQSLRTFREVLQDGSFGELYVGGNRPSEWEHVFASVQSLTAAGTEAIDADRFDVVIVDEFHHAEAATYRRLLDHLEPRVLVGMTATPERSDGLDVKRWFDGRFAFEMRLWDALDQRLLSPFQYFGIADDVDLSSVSWRGRYDTGELTNLYTGNDARVAKVLRSVREIVADPMQMRALGFCVSIDHAEFMARRFNEAGIPSLAVSSRTDTSARERALLQLKAGEVSCLFTVDLFNEGVDVPEIDTVLFLRPTESATVFLQQLGRGLRKAKDKPCLTVLDFVGQQHREFRFDLRFRAVTGRSRRQLESDVEHGFPYLPVGCHIQLDRQSEKLVLANVRQQLRVSKKSLAAELQQLRTQLGEVDLAAFLDETGVELEDLYRPTIGGWTRLQRLAGIDVGPEPPEEARLAKRLCNLIHLDDRERLEILGSIGRGDLEVLGSDVRQQRLLTMAVAALVGETETLEDLTGAAATIDRQRALRRELVELAEVLDERADHVQHVLGELPEVPLAIHGTYTRNEIAEAFGLKGKGWITGVRFDEDTNTDVFLVTLNKSEDHYTPTTMYRDFAISRERFHWESQSGASRHTGAGLRYVERSSRVLLFVRNERRDPYLFLGRVDLESAEGDRPIACTWRLRTPMPEDVFQVARAAAG